jgi:hypothetical protein
MDISKFPVFQSAFVDEVLFYHSIFPNEELLLIILNIAARVSGLVRVNVGYALVMILWYVELFKDLMDAMPFIEDETGL